jgi:hypothetical protein
VPEDGFLEIVTAKFGKFSFGDGVVITDYSEDNGSEDNCITAYAVTLSNEEMDTLCDAWQKFRKEHQDS